MRIHDCAAAFAIALCSCSGTPPPETYSLSEGTVRELRSAKLEFAKAQAIGLEKHRERAAAFENTLAYIERARHLDPMDRNPLLHGLIGDLRLQQAEELLYGGEPSLRRPKIDILIETAQSAFEKSLGVRKGRFPAREDYLPSRLGLVRLALLRARLAQMDGEPEREQEELLGARAALKVCEGAHQSLAHGRIAGKTLVILGIPLNPPAVPDFDDPALAPRDADAFLRNMIAEHLEWSVGNPRLAAVFIEQPKQRRAAQKPPNLADSLLSRLRGRIIHLEANVEAQLSIAKLPKDPKRNTEAMRALLREYSAKLRSAWQLDKHNAEIALQVAQVELTLDEAPERAESILQELVGIADARPDRLVLAMRTPLRLLIRAQLIMWLHEPSLARKRLAIAACDELDVHGIEFRGAPDIAIAKQLLVGIQNEDAELLQQAIRSSKSPAVQLHYPQRHLDRLVEVARGEIRRLHAARSGAEPGRTEHDRTEHDRTEPSKPERSPSPTQRNAQGAAR